MPHRHTIPLVTAVAVLAASAPAQPDLAVYPSNQRLREVFSAAHTQRIALVGIGDSNQLYNTHGWESGWNMALTSRYGVWGTALISAGEDLGWSSSVGTGASVQAAAPTNNASFQFSNAPEEAAYWMRVFPAIYPSGYLYINADVETAGQAPPHGMVITGASGLDLTAPLRFTFTHALFPEGRDLNAFVSEGPWGGTVIAVAPFSTDDPDLPKQGTRGEDHGGHVLPAPVATYAVDLPADPARAWGLRLWFGDERGRARGPLFLTYMQAENPERTTGAAVHTLYGFGGASAYDMASNLLGASDEQLTLFFARVREPLGPTPKVVVRINTGVNDRSEWMPSIMSGYTPGHFPAAFRDNIDFIVSRIRAVWSRNKWDAESELSFLLTVSHPIAEPDDPHLSNYRWALRGLADRYPDITVVDLPRLASVEEMLRRGWYNTPEDRFHLSPSGHWGVAERELDVLTRAPCHNSADNDNNGSVNTRDLLRLLEDFGSPGITPGWGGDLDADGDCDVADLVVMLGAFGAQTCNGE